MIGITLTTDQIRNAPNEVRQWIGREVSAALGFSSSTAPAPTSRSAMATAKAAARCTIPATTSTMKR